LSCRPSSLSALYKPFLSFLPGLVTMAPLFAFVALAAASLAPLVSANSNSCGASKFSFGGYCISSGGNDSCKGTPPSGKSCPSNWFWHTEANCCTPSTPTYSPTPTCSGKNIWDKNESCCKPPTTSPAPPPTTPTSPNGCGSNEFSWLGLKGQCCIPHGGTPRPPSPPPGVTCPSVGWWWHPGQGCCVPSTPTPPTPQCPGGWPWSSGGQCCTPPGPQPSSHYKRSPKKRSTGLCPIGLEACPVSGLLGLTHDYECVDTARELQSCGGCSSVHPELDCTSIEGSWNVGCEKGSCRVYSCTAGYKMSSDHTYCEKL